MSVPPVAKVNVLLVTFTVPVLLNEESWIFESVVFDWVTVPALLKVPDPELVLMIEPALVLLRLKFAPDLLLNTPELFM